jgi:predicted HTH domain antitoxin
MIDIVSLDLLEDELNAVTQAGNYGSQAEAINHALEILLVANPRLRVDTAMELYLQGRVTLMRAAEIAGLELEAFKQQTCSQIVASNLLNNKRIFQVPEAGGGKNKVIC